VAGRQVFLTTTNGTRALHHARLARRVLVGAFVNLSAVIASIREEPQIVILCAGTGGQVTREDLLVAGAMIDTLSKTEDAAWQFNESASAALRDWQELLADAHASEKSLNEYLAIELRDTLGGRNVLSIGMDQDLVACAQIDALNVVPELNVPEWRIAATPRSSRSR
jgi:2-phosphosulfolactate phosphatase